MNYKKDFGKNKKSLIKRNDSIPLSQKANNYVLINKSNKSKNKDKRKAYQLLKIDMKNDSLSVLFKNQKHIVQHQYTLASKNINNELENKKINIITTNNNDPKKIAFSEFQKKMPIFFTIQKSLN